MTGKYALIALRCCVETLEGQKGDAHSKLVNAAERLSKLNRWDFPEHLRPIFLDVIGSLGHEPSVALGIGDDNPEARARALFLTEESMARSSSSIRRLHQELEHWVARNEKAKGSDEPDAYLH